MNTDETYKALTEWEQTQTAIEYSPTIGAFAKALAAAQGEIKAAERDAENPYFRSSYASLASLMDVGREPLSKNGIAVVQGTRSDFKDDAHAMVFVTTMAIHESGEWMRSTVGLPAVPMQRKRTQEGEDDSDASRAPGRLTAQSIGSSITYGMRYGYGALIGVVPESDDDDGNAASGSGGSSKHKPIPADGKFEDVITDIGFREVPNKTGGAPYRFPWIMTGSHGKVECADKVAVDSEPLKGTAETVRFHAENGKFGWKCTSIERIKGPTAEELEILQQVDDKIAGCATVDEVSAAKEEFKTLGGLWWTGRVTEKLKAKVAEIKTVK